jgi:hypothetical protein
LQAYNNTAFSTIIKRFVVIRDRKQKGFTLLEMSVILIVVGLLIGLVINGQEIIEGMRIKKTMVQVNEIRSGWMGFYNKYNAIPGDFDRATELISTSSHEMFDGNGDNVISRKDFVTDVDGNIHQWFEYRFVWNQMDVAGFISRIDQAMGEYSEVECTMTGNCGPIPGSERVAKLYADYRGGEWYVMTDNPYNKENNIGSGGAPMATLMNPISYKDTYRDDGPVDDGKHYLFLGKTTGYYSSGDFNYRTMDPIVTGKNAAYIDRKYDNDDNKSGEIYYFCNLLPSFSGAEPLTNPLGESPECKMQIAITGSK